MSTEIQISREGAFVDTDTEAHKVHIARVQNSLPTESLCGKKVTFVLKDTQVKRRICSTCYFAADKDKWIRLKVKVSKGND